MRHIAHNQSLSRLLRPRSTFCRPSITCCTLPTPVVTAAPSRCCSTSAAPPEAHHVNFEVSRDASTGNGALPETSTTNTKTRCGRRILTAEEKLAAIARRKELIGNLAEDIFSRGNVFTKNVYSLEALPEGTFSMPEVAFIGTPGSGKSSMIASLAMNGGMGRKSLKVGMTKGLGFFNFGDAVALVDTPGYGAWHVDSIKNKSNRQTEQMIGIGILLQYLALRKNKNLRHVYWCFRGQKEGRTIRLTPRHEELLKFLLYERIPFTPILTSIDFYDGRPHALAEDTRRLAEALGNPSMPILHTSTIFEPKTNKILGFHGFNTLMCDIVERVCHGVPNKDLTYEKVHSMSFLPYSQDEQMRVERAYPRNRILLPRKNTFTMATFVEEHEVARLAYAEHLRFERYESMAAIESAIKTPMQNYKGNLSVTEREEQVMQLITGEVAPPLGFSGLSESSMEAGASVTCLPAPGVNLLGETTLGAGLVLSPPNPLQASFSGAAGKRGFATDHGGEDVLQLEMRGKEPSQSALSLALTDHIRPANMGVVAGKGDVSSLAPPPNSKEEGTALISHEREEKSSMEGGLAPFLPCPREGGTVLSEEALAVSAMPDTFLIQSGAIEEYDGVDGRDSALANKYDAHSNSMGLANKVLAPRTTELSPFQAEIVASGISPAFPCILVPQSMLSLATARHIAMKDTRSMEAFEKNRGKDTLEYEYKRIDTFVTAGRREAGDAPHPELKAPKLISKKEKRLRKYLADTPVRGSVVTEERAMCPWLGAEKEGRVLGLEGGAVSAKGGTMVPNLKERGFGGKSHTVYTYKSKYHAAKRFGAGRWSR